MMQSTIRDVHITYKENNRVLLENQLKILKKSNGNTANVVRGDKDECIYE